MNLEVRTYSNLIEITLESDNTKITEDIALYDSQSKEYKADENIGEEMLAAYFDIKRFNKSTDVDTMKEIFEAFLNTHEQEQFLEEIQE